MFKYSLFSTEHLNVGLSGKFAEDGFIITCKQWKCSQNPLAVEGETKLHPVLLINGYATESYWLPTEPNDMVRTLLGQGYETWLLQPRVHHSNSSNSFSIEDIGKYDIPAGKYQYEILLDCIISCLVCDFLFFIC